MVSQKYTSPEFLYVLLFYIVAPHSTIKQINKYIATILKAYVKDKNTNVKSSTTLSNYTRNVPVENDEIMVSFDLSS